MSVIDAYKTWKNAQRYLQKKYGNLQKFAAWKQHTLQVLRYALSLQHVHGLKHKHEKCIIEVSGVKLGATDPTPHSSTHALAMDDINPADSPRATLLKASIIIGLFTFDGRWTDFDFEDVDLLVDPLLPDEKEISLFIIAAYGTNGV